MTQANLENVLRDAQSDDSDVRSRGIHALWVLVQKDASLADVAMPIFRAALEQSTDGFTVANALRAVQKFAGEAAYHAAAMEVANYADAKVAARTVQLMSDPSFADDLIELMRRRPDSAIQISAMRTLGRMRASAAFNALIANLQSSELRPHAIEALSDLGEARAIPYLQPLLSDPAEAWQEDNHGPIVYVRDLARSAIEKLSQSASPTVISIAAPAASPATVPPPIPASYPAAAPYQPKTRRTRMQNLLPFMPMILAIVQVPWILILFFVMIVFHEDIAKNHAGTRVLDLLAMTPGLIGLAIGIFAITRWPGTIGPRVCLVIGMIGCALPQFPFGHELLH